MVWPFSHGAVPGLSMGSEQLGWLLSLCSSTLLDESQSRKTRWSDVEFGGSNSRAKPKWRTSSLGTLQVCMAFASFLPFRVRDTTAKMGTSLRHGPLRHIQIRPLFTPAQRSFRRPPRSHLRNQPSDSSCFLPSPDLSRLFNVNPFGFCLRWKTHVRNLSELFGFHFERTPFPRQNERHTLLVPGFLPKSGFSS